jgi:D-alanyl-D-alanine carboxypeptidase
MAKRLLACLLSIHVMAGVAAAPPNMDTFVRDYMTRRQIPGVAVLVRRGGATVRAKGYGLANVEHGIPVTPETVFQSGSMGKQFTALVVALLAEDGKLALDDPVEKHLEVPASWRGITIRHLLTHTSGLGDYPEDFSLQRDYAESDLLKMITGQTLAFAPGTKFNYSNLGYVTLGILIHKVSGEFYGDVLTRRVFQPLGMTTARIISDADLVPNRAAGYELKHGELKNQSWVSPSLNTTADGSLYFTINDLAKWDQSLDARTLVSEPMYQQIWTPVKLADGTEAGYGFGWSLRTLASKERVVEHGGAWQGFVSYIGRYAGLMPKDRLTVVVFANRAGADVSYIAHVVAGMYRPELAPRKHTALRLSTSELAHYAGDYRLDDRLTIHVSVAPSGDRLVTTFASAKVEMLPERIESNFRTAADFFEPDSDRTFRFEDDREGCVAPCPGGGAITLTISVPEKLVLKKVK